MDQPLLPPSRLRRATACGICAAVVMLAGACSSTGGSDPGSHTSTSAHGTRDTTATPAGSGTSTSTSQVGSAAARAAVLSAWASAEETLYSYLQEPWQQDRADLVAGETSGDLWPKLADYFANPALESEGVFLVGVKTSELNGPTSYNLGHPQVTALTATSATVAGCIYDTGTTTESGQPGPLTLDGFDSAKPYAQGSWTLQLGSGAWRVNAIETTSVTKC